MMDCMASCVPMAHLGHNSSSLRSHAPWCPACQQIQADWEKLGKLSETIGIRVGKVDVTREPGLSGRFFVTTLPTIYHAKDGVFRKYHGSRVLQDFQSFVTEKKWETLESISGWKSPSSFAMSGMAGLFRLSVWIRVIHSYLTETLGIPVWGSYIAFAMVTLLAGLILGLILVLIADCLCPTKSKYKSQVTGKNDTVFHSMVMCSDVCISNSAYNVQCFKVLHR
uniref:Thioredoxin-related transmembrane protein 4-like n=1 Tax=Callorhinchus milii TaxID=7868 RepID=A0A4W3GPW5_CALMI